MTSAKTASTPPFSSAPLRILIVTDAWTPQVNGVVRTLEHLTAGLRAAGHAVKCIEPGLFRTVPCPTYPQIRLALGAGRKVARLFRDFEPQVIHIATEGPLGFAARRHCLNRGLVFTTSLHTRFPEYILARIGIPISFTYRLLRWFHLPAASTLVATSGLRDELASRGFRNLGLWTRGVDLAQFRPKPTTISYPRPVWLYVGRAAVEKNVEAFLKLDLEGTKLVVGDGPQIDELRRTYPEVVFVGAKFGEELVDYYAAGDVFIFPSLTDTFGLVLLEALACGLPVAAFPVQGPTDVLGAAQVGALDHDLAAAARRALERRDPAACRRHAEDFSWERSTRQFLSHMAVNPVSDLAAERLTAAV